MEQVGDNFNISHYWKARELTILAVQQIASLVEVGMNEVDGHQLVDKVLEKLGYEKKWHPTKFRIGKNTLKSFRELSDEAETLKENDIFFIDIGPVFFGHEGDYGETFCLGDNQEFKSIVNASKRVFHDVSEMWKSKRLSGVKLYEFATDCARQNNYELNLKMNGHRLSDFPHAIHFKGKLGDVDIVPKEFLWVLEILIRHPEKEFGAFYEDVMI